MGKTMMAVALAAWDSPRRRHARRAISSPVVDLPPTLESFEPFRDLSAGGRQALRQGLRHQTFARRTTVLSRADPVGGAYIVVSGRLRVYTSSPAGREATLYEINPGETCVLALNCLFNDLRYPAWVDASAGTRVAIVDGRSYRWLFDTKPRCVT